MALRDRVALTGGDGCLRARRAGDPGQLVSVAMAAKLASRVVALCGEPVKDAPGYLCFPTPEVLAAVDPLALKALGMPVKRAESLIHLARSVVDGTFPCSRLRILRPG